MRIIIVCLTAWFIAQVLKVVINSTKYAIAKKKGKTADKVTLATLFKLGGMPSSHSSAVMALAVSCIIQYGWFSSQFAIAAVLAAIVMRDASGVRRETGEQSRVINMILNELIEGKSKDIDANLREIMGHTPLQVFVGALLGIAVPFGMAAIML